MTPFHHRKPGLIALLASPAPPNYSIIADGVHVAPAAVRCAWEMSRKMVLVTDAMAAMGLGDGAHKLGTMDVTKEGGRAVLTGTETLAGSVAR
jgi:N-acetylglucosamine-6-phosphate deacetylase